MWDRYDPRSPGHLERHDFGDRSCGTRGGTSDCDRRYEPDPRDVFTKNLDLPSGRDRQPVRERERVYEIDGAESRALATIGAFRVVGEGDLYDIRDGSQNSRRSLSTLRRKG